MLGEPGDVLLATGSSLLHVVLVGSRRVLGGVLVAGVCPCLTAAPFASSAVRLAVRASVWPLLPLRVLQCFGWRLGLGLDDGQELAAMGALSLRANCCAHFGPPVARFAQQGNSSWHIGAA